MSKRRLDVGDVGPSKPSRSDPSSSLKPGLKMNTYTGKRLRELRQSVLTENLIELHNIQIAYLLI